MSRRVLGVTMLLLSGLVVAGQSQSGAPSTGPGPEARWRRAVDAWDAGSYSAALEDMRMILRSPQAPEYLERVALLTGELYVTTEITPDAFGGGAISADGEYVLYVVRPVNPGPVGATRLVRVGAKAEAVAEFPGPGAFDRTGRRLAWFRGGQLSDTRSTEIVVRDLATGAEQVWLGPGLYKDALGWTDDSVIFLGGDAADTTRSDFYAVRAGSAPVRLTDEPGFKSNARIDPRSTVLAYTVTNVSPFSGRGGGGGAGGGGGGGAGRAGGGGGRGGAPPPPPNRVAAHPRRRRTSS